MIRCSRAAFTAALAVSPLTAQDPAPPPPEPERRGDSGQDPQDPARRRDQPDDAPPVVVTATRIGQDPMEVPYTTSTVDAEKIRQKGYRTTPQALRDVPGVMVQETSQGQGSPFLRGFTGYNNLFLIDGIRLNNSTFRAGPNQYWSTVDPMSLERIEVVMGPGSALYGSDAVGGVVQAFTTSPYAWGDKGWAKGGAVTTRVATAEDSVAGRGEVSVGYTHEDGARTGALLGGDAKAFGEVEGGHDTGPQANTDYEESAFDLKLEHWLDSDTRWVFLHQRLGQDDVPRTHATTAAVTFRGTAPGTDLRRDLDQDRELTYVQFHKERMGGTLDGLHASASWHVQSETQDRIRSNGAQERQGFTVGTFGAFVQAASDRTSIGRVTGGVELYHDNVNSFFRRATNPQPADSIQGPVGDESTYDLVGVYLQDQIELSRRLELTLGGRFTYAACDADSVRDPVTSTQISVDEDWQQFTGNARLRFDIDPSRWSLFGGVSQGFRAPSLSDLTSFETARSGEFEIPATDLDAEHYLSYEVGTKVRNEDVSAQLAWFYTDIEDQVQRFPTGNVNGTGQAEVTKANVGDGYIQGVELLGGLRVVEDTTLYTGVTWQYGRVTNFESAGTTLSEEFVSRLSPFTIRAGVRWDDPDDRCWIETEVVHAEEQDKLSFGDTRDTQRIPPGGTPGYWLWHTRGGWRITEAASLDVAFENITDYDYRVHGSGTNSPGRNLIFEMRVTF